ncbi:MAG: glycosyltransferase family 4 protein [Pyrinomonadaceae bacterium]
MAAARWRRLVWKVRVQFLSRLKRFHIFTSNRDAKIQIKKWVDRKYSDNIAVTYTSVDPVQIEETIAQTADRSRLRGRYGFIPDDFIVLCVGQFIDRKGRWIFLDAAKRIHKNHPEAVFLWLMPGQPDAGDLARIEKFGLGDNLRLIESASVGSTREDVLRFFRIADIFTLPSFIEGLPISLLEAMALGLPSISTNVYAIPEAITHRETGLLIPAGDPDALATAIMELKNDPVLRKKLSKGGSEFVLNTFDERTAAKIAIGKYEECFKNAG